MNTGLNSSKSEQEEGEIIAIVFLGSIIIYFLRIFGPYEV